MIRPIEVSYVVTGAVAAIVITFASYAAGAQTALALAMIGAILCWGADAIEYVTGARGEQFATGSAIAGIACYGVAAIITAFTLIV